MEDIARALRHAEMEKNGGRNASSSSPAAKIAKALLVAAVVGAAATLVFVSTPLGRDGPLREALVQVPALERIIESSTALLGTVPALSDEAAGGSEGGSANGSHPHHRLGARGGFAQDVQCEMNSKGECVMVASATPQLTEEEVAALMEEEDEEDEGETKNATTRTTADASASTATSSATKTTTSASAKADSAKKAQATATTSNNMSPLELRRAAAVGDESSVADCLSVHPEWVDEPDRNKWTSLHLAVRAGHLPVVRLLLKFGADVHAKTVSGESPLDMANKRLAANHPVTQLLQSHAIWLLSQKAASASSRSQ
jgi:Ankyrin repeats (many copies)